MPYNTDHALERMRELVAMQVPFAHQGCTANGLDCVGGLRFALQYDEPVLNYSRDPINGELERELRRILGAPIFYRANIKTDPVVTNATLRPLDIVSMHFAGPVRHVGMIGDYPAKGELSLIHTSASIGRVVEHRLDDKWRRRIVGVWRP